MMLHNFTKSIEKFEIQNLIEKDNGFSGNIVPLPGTTTPTRERVAIVVKNQQGHIIAYYPFILHFWDPQ